MLAFIPRTCYSPLKLPQKWFPSYYERAIGHVASHAVVNSSFPNGAIVLAQPSIITQQADNHHPSNSGKRGSKFTIPLIVEGMLTFESHETYWLGVDAEEGKTSSKVQGVLTGDNIENVGQQRARVALLSACSTGLVEVCGEGILGLARSLHKLGVPSVSVSLWNIEDQQELMSRLYAKLREGAELSKALQNVISIIQEKDRCGCLVYELKHWTPFLLLDSSASKLII